MIYHRSYIYRLRTNGDQLACIRHVLCLTIRTTLVTKSVRSLPMCPSSDTGRSGSRSSGCRSPKTSSRIFHGIMYIGRQKHRRSSVLACVASFTSVGVAQYLIFFILAISRSFLLFLVKTRRSCQVMVSTNSPQSPYPCHVPSVPWRPLS